MGIIKLILTINKEIKTFSKVFISLNLILSFYAIFFQNTTWLLNLQVAFFSSLLITLASFLSYRKNILNRVKNSQNLELNSELRDKIDEIDDPYDLYSEDIELKEEDLTASKIKEIIDNEKQKLKRNSFKNTIFSASGFLSIYRISAYLFLIFGFFALNNNLLFIPLAYIIGLGIVPVGVLISKIFYIQFYTQ